MSLDHPALLWLLLALPLELALALRRSPRLLAARRALTPPGDRKGREATRRGWGRVGIISSFILIVSSSFALAGPSWGSRAERVERSGLEIAIVLDVSRSMLARDVEPSRLAAAKSLAHLLLGEGLGDAFSLVAVKGEGLLLVPMTEDLDAVEAGLDYADPSVMTRAGTDLGSGILVALDSFSPIATSGRVVLLLSDGGDLGKNVGRAAAEARSKNIPLLTVGFGSAEGASIPAADGRPMVGTDGHLLRVALDSATLKTLALAAKGRYFDASDGGSLAAIQTELSDEGRSGTKTLLRQRSQAPLFAALALFALLLRLLSHVVVSYNGNRLVPGVWRRG